MSMRKRVTARGSVVIRIGYMDFYLPNDKGVAQVLQTLGKATRCQYIRWKGEMYLNEMEHGDISMQYVPEGIQIKDGPAEPYGAEVEA